MRIQGKITLAALAAQYVAAFPSMDMPSMAVRMENLKKRVPMPPEDIVAKRAPGQCGDSISGTGIPDPAHELCLFDAKKQYVSNKGQHAFKAPGPNDARGPCPGLNAMANHGYLPHSGIATIPQFVQGTLDVFGMAIDLGGFLAVLGASLDGDGLRWSIGGPNPLVIGGTGLTGSHNKYESDASPMRPDLYQYGNNYEVRAEQFKQLYDKQAGVSNEASNYNLAILQEFRSERWDASVQNNPYFFNGPFSGVEVQPAAYTFIYRFMGNKSAEHPEGQLTKETLKAFFGMTENADGSFSGGTGYEYIPDNWYKRAIGTEYSIPFFEADLLQEALVYPKFLSIGGNTGKPNTFTGIDVENFTGGVYNLRTLAEGNNAFCFAYQFVQQGRADIIDSLIKTLAPAASRAILSMGCPNLYEADERMLEQFPGYIKAP